MTYRVEVAPAALRQLRKLDPSARRRVQAAIELLADQPRPGGAKKLVGGEGEWRVRTGDYRIVYEVHDKCWSSWWSPLATGATSTIVADERPVLPRSVHSALRSFTGSAAIIVGSLSIGLQPLRGLGVGAWLLAMATGGAVAWVGRSAGEQELPAAPRWWSRRSARGSFARAAPVFMPRR